MAGSPYRESAAPAPVRQRVRRDRKRTLYALLGLAVSIGLFYGKRLLGGPFAVFCTVTSAIDLQDCGGMIVLGMSVVAVIGSLLSGFVLIFASGFCPCPVCGARLEDLSTFSNDGVSCPHCHQFCEGKRGQLWQTDPERIADSPTFRAPLPHKARFPKECCLCGKEDHPPAAPRDQPRGRGMAFTPAEAHRPASGLATIRTHGRSGSLMIGR